MRFRRCGPKCKCSLDGGRSKDERHFSGERIKKARSGQFFVFDVPLKRSPCLVRLSRTEKRLLGTLGDPTIVAQFEQWRCGLFDFGDPQPQWEQCEVRAKSSPYRSRSPMARAMEPNSPEGVEHGSEPTGVLHEPAKSRRSRWPARRPTAKSRPANPEARSGRTAGRPARRTTRRPAKPKSLIKQVFTCSPAFAGLFYHVTNSRGISRWPLPHCDDVKDSSG